MIPYMVLPLRLQSKWEVLDFFLSLESVHICSLDHAEILLGGFSACTPAKLCQLMVHGSSWFLPFLAKAPESSRAPHASLPGSFLNTTKMSPWEIFLDLVCIKKAKQKHTNYTLPTHRSVLTYEFFIFSRPADFGGFWVKTCMRLVGFHFFLLSQQLSQFAMAKGVIESVQRCTKKNIHQTWTSFNVQLPINRK